MRVLFTLLNLTLAATLAAQPLFKASDLPNVGDQDTLRALQYYPLNNVEESTGSSYVWDYTAVNFTVVLGNIEVDSFRIPQNAAFGNYYPAATIEEYSNGISAGTLNYFSITNDTLYQYGTGSLTAMNTFNPPSRVGAFPIAFGDSSYILTTHLNPFQEPWYTRAVTLYYDGFGTLKTQFGTYTNVFRIRKTVRDDNGSSVTTTISYNWYRQGGDVPLLRAVWTGYQNYYNLIGNQSADLGTGLEELAPAIKTVYPNPADNHVTISFGEKAGLADLSVTDLFGSEVKRLEGIDGESVTLDISGLAAGMYFIRLDAAVVRLVVSR